MGCLYSFDVVSFLSATTQLGLVCPVTRCRYSPYRLKCPLNVIVASVLFNMVIVVYFQESYNLEEISGYVIFAKPPYY